MTIFIDADILICSSYYSKSDSYIKLNNELEYIKNYYNGSKVILIAGLKSFRRGISLTYKSNRKHEPELVAFKQDIIRGYSIYNDPLLETDDILVLLAQPDDIVMTTDKDIRMLCNTVDFSFNDNKLTGDGLQFKQIINGDRADNVKPLMPDKASDTFIADYLGMDWSLSACLLVMHSLGLTAAEIINRFYEIKILERHMISNTKLINNLKKRVQNNSPSLWLSCEIITQAYRYLVSELKTMGLH